MSELENKDAPEVQQSPELTLADLTAIKSVLEVAVQRGAFKANELSVIGQTYDKLSSFLLTISRQAQKPNLEKGN